MYIATVKYQDYDGNDRTKDLCFHLSYHEIMKRNSSVENGDYCQKLIERTNAARMASDNAQLCDIFSSLMLKSYGTVIHDGGRFVRPANPQADLQQLPELDTFLELLVLDKTVGDSFIDGLFN